MHLLGVYLCSLAEAHSQSDGPECGVDGRFRLSLVTGKPDQRIVAEFHDVESWNDWPLDGRGDVSHQAVRGDELLVCLHAASAAGAAVEKRL